MSASAFFHSNTSRCADGIHCIPAAIHPDRAAASQQIRRSFSEKQFDRIPRELFYEISRRFHSSEAILLSFLYGLCLPGRDKAHIHDVSEKELSATVAEYIDFFNRQRPHHKRGDRTPDEIEKRYYLMAETPDSTSTLK